MHLSTFGRRARRAAAGTLLAALPTLAACGPHRPLPPVPLRVPDAADSADVALARALAPVLHVQRDEPFRLERVVAVVDPTRPVVAYHLLWSHDVNGQWLPWTKASDAEEAWVGYDPGTHEPTEVWSYWHGDVLHTSWRGLGRPAFAVQWGKHGTLPFGVEEADLRTPRTLPGFYVAEFALLPDILLGKLSHGGPWGFFHGYRRYRDFSRIVPLADRLDAVARTHDPHAALEAVFGERFAYKRPWPAAGPAPALRR